MPRLSALLLGGATLTAGCDPSLPGEVVGAFSVVMHLEENTCGSGVTPFPDGQKYAVELRSEGELGFWRLAKAPPVRGRYHDDRFTFAYAEPIELGMADAGTSGCIVLREESLEGSVGERDAPPDAGTAHDGRLALEGAHQVSFRPDPSARCRDARGPLREFERLPCVARYRLEGAPRAPF